MGQDILVVGGAGYVGSALVSSLIGKGNDVTVYDTYWYGDVFSAVHDSKLRQIKGDVRDKKSLAEACRGIDTLVHLACISNDPSFDLNPQLGKSVNFDAFFNVIDAAKASDIRRFIYASSSSVYGIKQEKDVTEKSKPEPITDYAKYKLECEKALSQTRGFEYVVLRPATICGYAPRVRLDLTVNILTINALEKGVIKVFGGKQLRPNLNIRDMVAAYELMIDAPGEKVDREVFNVGYENHSVEEIARIVQKIVGGAEIQYVETDDHRSYHIDSSKLRNVLGFAPKFSIEDAVSSIVDAYKAGKIIDGLNNPLYWNIKRMKELQVE